MLLFLERVSLSESSLSDKVMGNYCVVLEGDKKIIRRVLKPNASKRVPDESRLSFMERKPI